MILWAFWVQGVFFIPFPNGRLKDNQTVAGNVRVRKARKVSTLMERKSMELSPV